MNSVSPFKNVFKKAELVFDYETNDIKCEEEGIETKLFIFNKLSKTDKIYSGHNFWDNKDEKNIEDKKIDSNYFKANCFKRIVSQKKRRYQDEEFDLDLAYITKRIIAMGYPSTGCESIYRNNINDVIRFFEKKHNYNVKVYNLCIEPERIYDKSVFKGIQVGLFPSKDHNPCPVKLLLEFCVDITIYFSRNKEGVAAIHCKAGKGRTGVMICCYLIFSGLCNNTSEAIEFYAKKRTLNNKGVTISSQVRFIQYFETFLTTNFHQPYINFIPKMCKYFINIKTTNLIRNYILDPSYFISPNSFNLKSIQIGPFTSRKSLNLKIQDFLSTDFKSLLKSSTRIEKLKEDNQDLYFFIIEFSNNIPINSDLKVNVSSLGLNFYFWLNLWYSTLDLVKLFIDEIHDECSKENAEYKSRLSLHPKLRATSSITLKKAKRNTKGYQGFVLELKNIFPTNLKEELLDESSNKSRTSINELVPKEIKGFSFKNISKNFSNLSEEQQSEVDEYKNKSNDNVFKNNIINVKKESEEIKQSNNNKSNKDKNQVDEIAELLDHLNNETDLNHLIDSLNNIRMRTNKKIFTKDHMIVSLNIDEVDKFFEAKKQHKKFTVDISFKII